MLVKIVIENFKNFQVEQTLGLYEADEDSSAFTILVGKNGAGKSSTLDALEWVVFNKSSNTMRASKRDDLICFGKDYARVEAVFVNRVEGISLSITRLHQRGGKTTSTAVLRSIREDAKFDIIRKLHGIDEISNVLQSQFKIDVTNIERILIKQQNASSIACTAPKQLLKYLETFTGSDKIDMAANNHLLNSMDITAELSDVLIAREELLVAIKDMQPNVDAATALKTEQKQLNEDFRRLFAAELRILELSEKMTAESLRFVKDEHKSILKNIQSACAIFDTLISSLRDLKSAERNTVQACHHCDEIISDAEEQLRKLIDDREFILQEEAKKSKKIKGLKKLVKTQRESTSRLEKSRAEKSEELLNLQNQADDINSCISQLLQPSSVKDTDGVGSETSSITRLNLIKCLLNDIKELDTAGNDAAEWADSISKIEAQTSSRRKNFENLNLKYAALKDRLKASDENLVVVDDRIMVLKKELRNNDRNKAQLTEQAVKVDAEIHSLGKATELTINDRGTMEQLNKLSCIKERLCAHPGCEQEVVGALCDFMVPSIPSLHTTALLAILGTSLTQTFIVSTRSAAMIVAKMCQEFEGLSLTIDILNEIRLPATVQTSLEGRNDRGLGNVDNDDISVARKSLGTLGDVALVMPMNDCVKLNSIAIFPAVNKRLGNWYFFNGTGYEAMQHVSRSKARCNIVARDGSRIMRDGEIRMTVTDSESKQLLSRKSWPSTSSNYRQLIDGSCDVASALESSKALKLKSQLSLADIYHREISSLLEEKENDRREIIDRKKAFEADALADLLDGCPANDMKTFRAYMNKNGADLNSEEKKLVEDRKSHEKAAADLEISNVLLQTALSSTLGTFYPQDKFNECQEQIIRKIAEHELIISNMARIESATRIIEAESLVLQKSIEKYAQNLMSIQQPTITLTDAKDNGRKNAEIQENNQQKSDRLICTNTESYETERRRRQEIIGMIEEERYCRKQILILASSSTREHTAKKTLARAELESLRRKKDTTFQQLQSSEEKLLSITQAAEFKRSQLSDVHSKLLIEEVAMPQLDKTDLDFECHKSYDGTDSCSSLGDVLHPGQLPETAVDAEALKSSLISIKEERCAIDDHELKKIAGRNQEKAVQNDEAIVSALVKRDPDIRIKDTLDSICCSGKNSNTGSKKLTVHDRGNKSAERLSRASAYSMEESKSDVILCHNTEEDLDSSQIDLLGAQLQLRSKDIQRRSKAIDSATIFQHYVELLTKLRSTSQDAKKLSAQARTEQRKRNELQGERFSLLTHSMLEINSRLSATYKRIVPEGDCYLNYASNPISLFEEGATLFAQHGQGSWQEASHLSGGQQAACSLSLILALQDCFPSPIYIMDEVDASLDTSTVARVGALIREKSLKSGIQFLLASHRPEMQECASRLVGLYLCRQVPRVLSIGFVHSQAIESQSEDAKVGHQGSTSKLAGLHSTFGVN